MTQEDKRILTDILRKMQLVEKESVGQIVIHVNNGGVTKIQKDKWDVK